MNLKSLNHTEFGAKQHHDFVTFLQTPLLYCFTEVWPLEFQFSFLELKTHRNFNGNREEQTKILLLERTLSVCITISILVNILKLNIICILKNPTKQQKKQQ